TAFWDDFESGNVNGWDFYGPGSTASTGDWLIGNPNGTSTGGAQAQPEDAFAGLGCAFTAQNSGLGTDDVDNGVVYLVSPTIDLSGQVTAEFRFVRWFYQRDLGDDANDFYVTDISSDDGASWVNLETLGASQRANEWTQRVFLVEDFVPLTNAVKVRFGASDGPGEGDIVESAIDDVLLVLTAAPCEPPTAVAEGGRWIAASAAPGEVEVALLVTGDPGNPAVSCVSQYVQADGLLGPDPVYQLPSVWDTIRVRGAAIIPASEYHFQAECLGGVDPVLSSMSSTTTWEWGDVDRDGDPDFLDALLQVRAFKDDFSEVTIEAADLEPCTPDGDVGFLDILMTIMAFKDRPYTDSGCSNPCP
ncbi:MAG: hypothetical protein IID43_00990, partial [Planctomycetes bacterium]|nr:hypothetical protein [Planctomycetota bacterium]